MREREREKKREKGDEREREREREEAWKWNINEERVETLPSPTIPDRNWVEMMMIIIMIHYVLW